MSGEDTLERMREDWNARAREDAHYYVAFGRRDQPEEEFLATAEEVVKGLKIEMKRLPPGNPRARRALEIGCGPGRLMWFMAAHFGEIHGVDVSDEMIQLAHQKLKDIPHAHAHATSGADLKAFADESFDYVYSYAVFQHIPGREVVFQYLREARRVMKPGAVMRCQFNGLPEAAVQYDTWSGVRISSVDLMSFLREQDFQLLALEGASTQYMWVTARKQSEGWQNLSLPVPAGVNVRRITNAHSSEPVAPSRGRFASVSLWIEGLPEYADLLRLEVHVGGWRSTVYYIGAPERDGLRQVNAMLPWEIDTGLQNVEVKWCGEQLCRPRNLRIIPPPPLVPRVVALSDGINLLSGTRIVTGSVKVTLEEVSHPDNFRAEVDGDPVQDAEIFCTDPLAPRFEVNFHLPEGLRPGPHQLEMRLGERVLAPVTIEVAG